MPPSAATGWRGRALVEAHWLPLDRWSATSNQALFTSEPVYNGLNHYFTTGSQVEYSQGQIIYDIEMEGDVWKSDSEAGIAFEKILDASIEHRSDGLKELAMVPTHTGTGSFFTKEDSDIIIDSFNLSSRSGSNVKWNALIKAGLRTATNTNLALAGKDFADSGWKSTSPRDHTTGPIPYWQSSVQIIRIFLGLANHQLVEWSMAVSNKAEPIYSHGRSDIKAGHNLLPRFIYPGYMEITGNCRYYDLEGKFPLELFSDDNLFQTAPEVESGITIEFGDFKLNFDKCIINSDNLPNEGLNTIVLRTLNWRALPLPDRSVVFGGSGAKNGIERT